MVLVPGDLVGEGCLLQGETIRPVFSGVLPVTSALEPATKFKIGHILRRGIHDVVYLAREVLTPPSAHQQEHFSIFGLDNRSSNPTEIPYAREYTIKCLFKGDPDSDELAKQMSEVRVIPTFPILFPTSTINPGPYSPVSSSAPQHCDSLPCPGNISVSTSSFGVCPWPRFIFFHGGTFIFSNTICNCLLTTPPSSCFVHVLSNV